MKKNRTEIPFYLTGFSILIACVINAQLRPAEQRNQSTSKEQSFNAYRTALQSRIDSAMRLNEHQGLILLKKAVVELATKLPASDTSVGNLYHKTGVLHYTIGEYAPAIESFTRALPIRERNSESNTESYLHTLNGLAQSHLQLLHYDSSEYFIEKQLDVIGRLDFKDNETLADLYLADAQLAYIIEDYTRCREKLLLAKQLYKRSSPSAFNHGLALNILGVTNHLLNEPERAIHDYEEALSIFKANREVHYEALTYHNLGMAYRSLKNNDKAKNYFDSAYRIHKINSDSIELARYFIEMAKLYASQSQYDKASELAYSSLSIRKNALPTWHPDVLESEVVSGEIRIKQARIDTSRSIELCKKAKFQLENAALYALNSPRPENAVIPLASLSILMAEAPKPDNQDALSAHALFLRTDSLIQLSRLQYRHQESKIDFTQRVRSMYSHAIRNAMRLYKHTGDPKYFSDALAFADRSKSTAVRDRLHQHTVQNYAGIPDSIIKLQHQLHLQLGAATQSLLSVKDHSDPSYLSGLKALEEIKYRLDKLDEQTEQDYPRYYQWLREPQQQLNVHEIQSRLQKGTAMVEYFMGEDRIHVFAITGSDFGHWEIADPESAIQTISEFIHKIENSDRMPSKDVNEYAHKAFQLLLEKPLIRFGLDEKITNIKIVPDGIIWNVPFDALVTSHSENQNTEIPYLIRHYSHSLLYSNRLVPELNNFNFQMPGPKNSSVFGIDYLNDPAYYGDSTYSGLPFVKDEVEQVKTINNAEVFVNEKATVNQLKEMLVKADMLHVALHGTFVQNKPEASGLVFSKSDPGDQQDNILSLASIYGLQTKAKFIYLSSCFSGKGRLAESEGVMSLSRAFTYAGIKSQVISLWEVSDRASSFIAREFYQQLKQGEDKDVALRKAKLRYLEESTSSIGQSPYFWAGTVLVGSSEALYSRIELTWILGLIGIGSLLLILIKRRTRAAHIT